MSQQRQAYDAQTPAYELESAPFDKEVVSDKVPTHHVEYTADGEAKGDVTLTFATDNGITSYWQLSRRTHLAVLALWLSNFASWSSFIFSASTETNIGALLGDTAHAGWLAAG